MPWKYAPQNEISAQKFENLVDKWSRSTKMGFPATAGERSRHAARHVRDVGAVMHAGIANWRTSLKSVAGKTIPAFPAHAKSTILRI